MRMLSCFEDGAWGCAETRRNGFTVEERRMSTRTPVSWFPILIRGLHWKGVFRTKETIASTVHCKFCKTEEIQNKYSKYEKSDSLHTFVHLKSGAGRVLFEGKGSKD